MTRTVRVVEGLCATSAAVPSDIFSTVTLTTVPAASPAGMQTAKSQQPRRSYSTQCKAADVLLRWGPESTWCLLLLFPAFAAMLGLEHLMEGHARLLIRMMMGIWRCKRLLFRQHITILQEYR